MNEQGYNIDGLNKVIDDLNASYSKLGETIASKWPPVSQVLGTEWVGPDELSFEKSFAKRLCDLYHACRENIEITIENLRKVGFGWQEFQNTNKLEGADIQSISLDIHQANLPDYNIESVVKAADRTFNASMRMGLTSGQQSVQGIETYIKNYVNEVDQAVKLMYAATSTSEAFLDQRQSAAIDEYLKKVGALFAKVVTDVSDLEESLTVLVSNYESQVQAVKTSFDSMNVDSSTTTQP